jgi:chorismate dehydratase
VPVALLPELSHYKIVTDFCIGADGIVDSVKLYSQVPLNEIETITLDYQSRSSITLTKVLCKFFWKLNVQFLDSTPGFETKVNGTNAAVVIGDRTFALNGTYKYEFDLANEWKKFSGLPFVFAAWVSVNEIDPNFISEFNEVLRSGIENTSKAIAEDKSAAQIKNLNATDYLTKKISYNLDPEKRKALDLFLDYIGKL